MKKTITKTIKVGDIGKDYSINTITYSPFSYTYTNDVNSCYYRIRIDKTKADKMLKNDLDKNIKNIRIVYEVEQEILDEEEKKYLSNVIKPFKNRVKTISKQRAMDGDCYILIDLGDDDFALPYFKKSKMYCGMEDFKEYTMEELGL